ncbi:MAG TPA: tripartite tricarboxylate transporter substrate binding protein [Burkholderiales bacterium]|jgi:tripartite-type tricarboxylate transporter receptor subunit TctC|nr:tripartite tricarboxylate transporter substrate binding protein [Burkholderiales bacterium]
MVGLHGPLRLFPVVAAFVLAATSAVAQPQQKFPTKPIRIVVPFSPGGGTDTVARIIAQKMGESWGQTMVIENRTGAGGTIGTALVAKATPDGHTLLVSSSAFAINAALQPALPYDPLKDFAGVTRIGYSKSTLVVTPTLGVKTLKDFIELARARPGKIFFSSGGSGSSTHLNAERFRLAAGIKPVHVAFKGSADATLEVVAGRCHYVISGLISTLPFIRDGRLVALAVVTPERSSILPDVPTVAETLPGYKRDGSHVMLAPAGTPRPILERISNEVRRIFDLPEVKERLANFDYLLVPSTPAEMDKILRADIATFSEVVIAAGLRPKGVSR